VGGAIARVAEFDEGAVLASLSFFICVFGLGASARAEAQTPSGGNDGQTNGHEDRRHDRVQGRFRAHLQRIRRLGCGAIARRGAIARSAAGVTGAALRVEVSTALRNPVLVGSALSARRASEIGGDEVTEGDVGRCLEVDAGEAVVRGFRKAGTAVRGLGAISANEVRGR